MPKDLILQVEIPGGVKTSLPLLGDSIKDPKSTFEIGYFFADPPLSVLTPSHGFTAVLLLPPENDPISPCSSPPPFRRVERIVKEKKSLYWHSTPVPVRCLVDDSSTYTLVSSEILPVETEVNRDEAADWICSLGPLFINSSYFLGSNMMTLVLDNRFYTMEVWIVSSLFPGHKDVDIHVVLGRDFLRGNPGLLWQAVSYDNAVDLIPFPCDIDGADFDINARGELAVHVCGHEEPGLGGGPNKAFFGVYFGPGSAYNFGSRSLVTETPLTDAATIEASMCVVFTALMEREATFNSVRIYTDVQVVIDMLNPGGKLEEYRSRDWTNKKGKKLNLANLWKMWAEVIAPELQVAPWAWRGEGRFRTKGVLVFEKVDKKHPGLQAARHLAQAARNSVLFKTVDRGMSRFGSQAQWKDYLFTHLPQGIRVRHPKNDCEMSRLVASSKAPRAKVVAGKAFAAVVMAAWFPKSGILGLEVLEKALVKDRMLSAVEVLAMGNPDFVEGVMRVARERGVIREGVELVGIEGGLFHFVEENDEDQEIIGVGEAGRVREGEELVRIEERLRKFEEKEEGEDQEIINVVETGGCDKVEEGVL